MEGWVKFHRRIIDTEIFQNDVYLKVYMWLLCKASTADRFVRVKVANGVHAVPVKKGQMIFGRLAAEQELGISGSTIYKAIHAMKDMEVISIESNSKFSIITMLQNAEDEQEEFDIIIEDEENGTAKKQQKNSKKTAKKQDQNRIATGSKQDQNQIETQYKNIENIIESKEFEESKEREQCAVVPPVAPAPREEKISKEFPGLHRDMMDRYQHWYMRRTDGNKPILSAADGKAVNSIMKAMKASVLSRNEAKGVSLGADQVRDEILKGWEYILTNWDRLDKFNRERVKLLQISADFNNIVNFFKNGTATNKQGGGVKASPDEIHAAFNKRHNIQ
jgi:hypothetical protein